MRVMMSEYNYRELLKKYMMTVLCNENVTFIEYLNDGFDRGPKYNNRDRLQIKAIEQEVLKKFHDEN